MGEQRVRWGRHGKHQYGPLTVEYGGCAVSEWQMACRLCMSKQPMRSSMPTLNPVGVPVWTPNRVNGITKGERPSDERCARALCPGAADLDMALG